MQRSLNWGLVVQGGTTASYQCPGTSSNFLSIENGGHNKPNNDSFIKKDLGSFVEKEHNYFSRIPSQCSKLGGRQIGSHEQ